MSRSAQYQFVVKQLRERITAGNFPPGSRLPGQTELARALGVDRNQIRRAQQWMIERGELASAQGFGVWVSAGTYEYAIHAGTRFGQQLRAAGYETRTTFIGSRRIVPPWNVLRLLELKSGSRVVRVDLLRQVNGLPAMLAHHYYKPNRMPTIADLIAQTGSVTQAMSMLGLELLRGATTISSRLASPAELRHLEIAPSQPIVEIIGCNIDKSGEPLEVSVAIARSDRIRLHVPPESWLCDK